MTPPRQPKRVVTQLSPHACFAAGVAVLLIYNVARGFGLFGPFDDASMVLLLGVFVVLARRARLTRDDLGLAGADVRRGATYGLVALVVTTVVLVVVALIPATSDLLEDSRAEVSGPRLVFEITVLVLLVTVIPEEFAFRGVLLASGRAVWGDRVAVLATSVLFGLWHISPTLQTMTENRQLDDATTTTGGAVLLVTGSVLATFVAGLVFSWLRLRSRSLVAPVLAHLGTNGVALFVAWFVVQ
jgi:membrane protease YdiL (CAAX protease family)